MNNDITNNDVEVRAAEYVLGTLDVTEREAVEQAMRSDPALRDRIAVWERSFARFNAAVDARQPSARVWDGIERRIMDTGRVPDRRDSTSTQTTRFGWWRATLGVAGLAAAVLIAVILLPNATRVELKNPDFVAVLADAGEAPVWLVKASTAAGQLTIDLLRQSDAVSRSLPMTRNGAEPRDGQLALWMVLANGAAKSLGVLPEDAERLVLDLPPGVALAPSSRLVVTLESAGSLPEQPGAQVVYEGLVNPYKPGS